MDRRMIKTAIKHFIYDKCIDILFNSIEMNFSTYTKKWEEMMPGKMYTWVKIKTPPDGNIIKVYNAVITFSEYDRHALTISYQIDDPSRFAAFITGDWIVDFF